VTHPDGDLAGMLCGCDMDSARPDARVRDSMSPCPLFTGLGESLAAVAETMERYGVGALPVIDHEGRPVGIITRSDLRRRGALPDRPGVDRCAKCGASHQLCPRGVNDVCLCRACREDVRRDSDLSKRQPTTALPTLFGRLSAAFDEHASLCVTVDRLEQWCDPLAQGQERADLDFEPSFSEFAEQLLAHFAAEEAGGYFGTMGADRPGFVPLIVRLRAEHGEMRAVVERLLAAVRNGLPGKEIATLLGNLIERFRAHEEDERKLMQEFFATDEGGGD
jgi:hypothetical protein